MQKLACSLQFLHFYLSKENATPQKAEMNRGYEGVPPLPTLLSSSQPALGQKRCPCRSCCPQTKRPSGSFPNTRLLTRPSVPLRDADGEPRSRRLHSQFLPPQGPFPPGGTAALRHRRRAGPAGRVLPAAGHAAPSGLALAAARPSPPRFKSPLRDPPPPAPSPEMMWPRLVTPTPGHPGRRCRRGGSPPAGAGGRSPGARPVSGSAAAAAAGTFRVRPRPSPARWRRRPRPPVHTPTPTHRGPPAAPAHGAGAPGPAALTCGPAAPRRSGRSRISSPAALRTHTRVARDGTGLPRGDCREL